MSTIHLATSMDDHSDEELMALLVAGREDALAPLHRRYASLIFNLAAQSLDRAAAEEITQDVFLAVWRGAGSYDPARGPVRPWILRIAHLRVLNEFRRRGRRLQFVSDPEGAHLNLIADDAPQPDEAAWREFRRTVVQDAVAALPPPQRQALSLAFFEDLTHAQTAAFLGLPLGTTKTRIRAGLQKLRVSLVALAVVTLALVGGLASLAIHDQQQLDVLDRNQQALRMVTSSDMTAIRLVPAAGIPAESHGTYRSRPGVDLAVLTLSHLQLAPSNHIYQAWSHQQGSWRSLGTIALDATGGALLIVDQHGLGTPDALQVTLESSGGAAAPTGPVIVAWPGS